MVLIWWVSHLERLYDKHLLLLQTDTAVGGYVVFL